MCARLSMNKPYLQCSENVILAHFPNANFLLFSLELEVEGLMQVDSIFIVIVQLYFERING